MFFGKKIKTLLSDRRLLGQWGQKQCEKFLRAKGCKILSRNFSSAAGEIDLIAAEPAGSIVFVEVKTRANEDYADAEAAVTKTKQIRMTKTANLFVKKHRLDNMPLRFDVVTIIAGQKAKPQIRHYENAF